MSRNFFNIKLSIGRKTDQQILILGLAKTGTTALFFKIKNSMPPSTQTFFEPRKFDPGWLRGKKPVLAKVIFQSNLGIHYESFDSFPKKIMMVRDPRDIVVSSILYYSAIILYREQSDRFSEFLSLLKEKEQDSSSVTLRKLLQFTKKPGTVGRSKNPREDFILFFQGHPDYFVFKYEQLIDGDFESLERYLEMPLTGAADVGESYSRVVRTKGYGDWKNWFTQEDVEYFRPLLTKYMRQFGYNDDWALPSEPRISPEYSSRYVERIITSSAVGRQ